MRPLVVLVALLCICAEATAQVGDVDRGRALYENHCQVCHTSKVHTRINKIAVSRSDVRALVSNWQAQEKLQWGNQDIDDVVEYLSRTRYRFQ